MTKQTTADILMIEPVCFNFNEQTAVNNYFQRQDRRLSASLIQKQAHAEFMNMVKTLREKGVRVIAVKDTPEPLTPDSIFPNNWVSFHEDGTVIMYPMYAENRRGERRKDILDILIDKGFEIKRVVDFSRFENENKFLEGTGSLILDKENKIAYAALSERTNIEVLNKFCALMAYSPVTFHADQTVDGKRLPIYHSNVMMNIASQYGVICLEAIDDLDERENIKQAILSASKELIEITEKQMCCFAGNMLQVETQSGNLVLVLSQAAYDSLSPAQITKLNQYNELLPIAVPTIEKYGGGSVRCMMAEVFLNKK